MVQWQGKSKRKATGGIRRTVLSRDKKLSDRGGVISETKLGAEKKTTVRGVGSTVKVKLLQSNRANIIDEKGKIFKAEIVTVKGNAANKLFVRRNIITKGAVIEIKHGTDHRLASVTNRPGQSGTIEARLLPVEAANQFKKQQGSEEAKTVQKGEKKQKNAKEEAKQTT